MRFIMQEYNSEICKNHCQIVGQKKKKKWNDMVVNVSQPKHISIKRHASAFSNNIYIDCFSFSPSTVFILFYFIFSFKLKRLWVGLDSGSK